MIDMAQADRTLLENVSVHPTMSWITALQYAAEDMGYSHYVDVPDDMVAELKSRAKTIQSVGGK